MVTNWVAYHNTNLFSEFERLDIRGQGVSRAALPVKALDQESL